jgi:hypothetical protein
LPLRACLLRSPLAGSSLRCAAFVVTALLALLAAATPAAAASATSWRAVIVGTTLHGGATTLITSDGTGSINITLKGVTPGHVPIVAVNPTACPAVAPDLFSFRLPAASLAGVSGGRNVLTAAEVRLYNADLSARIKLSIRVVTGDDQGCGDQLGAPSVGTARLMGMVAAVAAPYDLRYPVVNGIDPTVAASVDAVFLGNAMATLTSFTKDATAQGPPRSGAPPSSVTQTFSVSLSEPALLSLGELSTEYLAQAAHPIATLSTFTFDLRAGQRLTLAGLFRPGSPYLADLSTQSRARLRVLLHLPSLDSQIDAGTRPSASNFQAWQLVPSGLRITFAEYQVGPFYIGMPAIVIPWSSLPRSSYAPSGR